jgi:hypothetical protein
MDRSRDTLHTRLFIWLGLAAVLGFNCFVRWRLLAMPLERDEGEYAYAGQLILQGVPPYQLAWNMKFPGAYFAYAALMKFFGETPQGIHFGILLITSVSAILIFLIGSEWLGALGGLMAAAAFTGLSAVPMTFGLAGHATHFIVLFICAGVFALLKADKKSSFAWMAASGISFGIAILMKQHAVAFPVFIGLWLMWEKRTQRVAWKKIARPLAIFGIGCAVPLLVMCAALAYAGVWDKFWFWTVDYARQYVSLFPLGALPRQFATGFAPIFETSAWLWLLGLAGLVLVLGKNQRHRPVALAGVLFLAGMAATVPGFYFRGHYFLMAIPGVALLIATAVSILSEKFKDIPFARMTPAALFCLALAALVADNSEIWFKQSTLEVSRSLYDLSPFPESTEIASYLQSHTNPDDTIAVLGSEPQIFFLAHRRSASGYIYMYPMTEPEPLAPQMQADFINEIEKAKPKYVVFVNLASSWLSVIYPNAPPEHPIPDWWHGYSQNYELVGVVNMAEDKPSQFLWDEQVAGQTPLPSEEITVFRQKS